jgi:soluble lytic murein transglycosylase-like protein
MIVIRVWLFVAFAVWAETAEAGLEEALLLYESADDPSRVARMERICPKKVAFSVPGSIPRHREQGISLVRQLRTLAIREARAHRVPPDLFLAVVSAESCWNPAALGQANEISLVQMLPTTFEDLRMQGLVSGNPWEARPNLHAGAVYLRQIIESFTKADFLLASQKLGLTPYAVVAAAYNAGPLAVKESIAGRRQLPASTRIYTQTVKTISRRERVSIRKEERL